jgi:peptidoglycan hydrolase-like protein with peptidoglycan-binding domain
MSMPGPRRAPSFWDIVIIGDFALPAVEKKGGCKVKVKPSIKLDDKKKPGKDKSNPTVERIENKKISIECWWNEDIWEQMEPAIRGLDPDGKPRDIIHPATAVYNIGSILIEEASEIEHQAGIMSITYSGQEWKPDASQGQQVYLQVGSQGPEVTRWQTFLTEQKFGEAEGFSPIDGIFQGLTRDGTKGFQTREAIRVDGIVGPETFGAASKYGYVPPPPIKGGSGVKTPDSSTAAPPSPAPTDPNDPFGINNEGGSQGGASGEVPDPNETLGPGENEEELPTGLLDTEPV